MNEFNGLNRDVVREKIPSGMYEFARNILKNKKRSSISNEYGFTLDCQIPGKFIGGFTTNFEKIIFSVLVEENESYSLIGKIENSEYIPIIKTKYLGFKDHRPIEAVWFYNYAKELITIFVDGVADDSNSIKLINLTNLGVELDSNFELVNEEDVSLFEYQLPLKEGTIDISYTEFDTVLPLKIVYITYSYVLDDNITTTKWLPVSTVAYPTYGYLDELRKQVIINISLLDITYKNIKIGIIVEEEEEGLKAYTTPLLSISPTGTVSYTISSLSSFSDISIDELLIPLAFYTKAKTITTHNNTVLIGNLVEGINKEEIQKDLQKYVNMLNLNLFYINDGYHQENKENSTNLEFPLDLTTHPTLAPDEVYAVYIQFQLTNGEYLDALPLIGRVGTPTEKEELTQAQLVNEFGLRDSSGNGLGLGWKRFHIENSGGVATAVMNYDKSVSRLIWGYWENEEKYPNVESFNSVDVGGEDLRDTPIRLFRVPGLDSITEYFPCTLGYTDRNNLSDTGGRASLDSPYFGQLPRFGISIYSEHLKTIIPADILKQFQSYKLVIAKRSSTDRLVEEQGHIDDCIKSNHINLPDFLLTDKHGYQVEGWNGTGGSAEAVTGDAGHHFGRSTFYGITANIDKKYIPENSIIKCNFISTLNYGSIPLTEEDITPYKGDTNINKDLLLKPLNDTQKYGLIKRVEYLLGNNIVQETPYIMEQAVIYSKNYKQAPRGSLNIDERWNPMLATISSSSVLTITATLRRWNSETRNYENIEYTREGNSSTGYRGLRDMIPHITILSLKKNVYNIFSVSDFITIGRVDLTVEDTDPIIHKSMVYGNGDVFTYNLFKKVKTSPNMNGGSALRFYPYLSKGNLSEYNNAALYLEEGFVWNKPYHTAGSSQNWNELNALNYSFKIFEKNIYRSLNDKVIILAFNYLSKYISSFPYRIARSLSIPNENLSTNNVRTFLANSYYDMPNNRGEIIVLRGTNRQVYIQQRFSLFIALYKDVLEGNIDNTTYLGRGDLFDRPPEEVYYNQDKGYIGCTSQIACIVIPQGLITIDQIKGKIFITAQQPKEISSIGLFNYFQDNWNTFVDLDNPYTQIGHLVGYDEKNNRLLFTKKDYELDTDEEVLYNEDTGYYYTTEQITCTKTIRNRATYVLYTTSNTHPIFAIDKIFTITVFKTSCLEDNDTMIFNGTFKFRTGDESDEPDNQEFYIDWIEGDMLETINNIMDKIIQTYNSYTLDTSIILEAFYTDETSQPSPFYALNIKSDDAIVTATTNYGTMFTGIISIEVSETVIKDNLPYNSSYFKETSKTFSYNLTEDKWIAEHDYYPNAYLDDNLGIYGIHNEGEDEDINYKLFNLFDKKAIRGKFFKDTVFPSYVDLLFNQRLDLSKLYQNVSWETVCKTIDNVTKYNKTIDKIAIYSDYQCSGIIDIDQFNNCRNVEGVWNFNQFRDYVIDSLSPIVDNVTGEINTDNLNFNKSYFDKNQFIGIFVVVRMIMNNGDTDDLYINFVNVKSRISKR